MRYAAAVLALVLLVSLPSWGGAQQQQVDPEADAARLTDVLTDAASLSLRVERYVGQLAQAWRQERARAQRLESAITAILDAEDDEARAEAERRAAEIIGRDLPKEGSDGG